MNDQPGKDGFYHEGLPVIHDVEWNAERVQRFWNWYGGNPALAENYFAKLVGRDLIRFVEKRAPIGLAFDMGCGRGDLLGYLIERYDAMGSDQSPDSIEAVKRRFEGAEHFRGAIVGTNIGSGIFDTVFLLEVVEHLPDEILSEVLTEAHRLLKPGGTFVVSTPNNENLDSNKIICPECACVFHIVQHVRSWSADTLTPYINGFGFAGQAAPTRLSREGKRRRLQSAIYRQLGYKPHLVYIGKKK
jgi:SAM-dependent methyltransferase